MCQKGINPCKDPAPEVSRDILGAACGQPAFVQSGGRGKHFEQLARASTFQAGRWPCVLAGRRAGRSTRLTLCLLAIAGGKQELWPAHVNCLLPSPTSEVAVPIHPTTLLNPPEELGQNKERMARPLSGMDIFLFIYKSTPLLRAVKY